MHVATHEAAGDKVSCAAWLTSLLPVRTALITPIDHCVFPTTSMLPAPTSFTSFRHGVDPFLVSIGQSCCRPTRLVLTELSTCLEQAVSCSGND